MITAEEACKAAKVLSDYLIENSPAWDFLSYRHTVWSIWMQLENDIFNERQKELKLKELGVSQ